MRPPVPLPRPAQFSPSNAAGEAGNRMFSDERGMLAGVPVLPPPRPGAMQGQGGSGNLDLARIKRNVKRMADQGAPIADIDGYIASEGATLDQVRSASMAITLKGSPGKKSGADEVSQNLEVRPKEYGVGMNLAGGINRVLLDLTGGAVDRSRNVINWGVAGVNALTGQPDLTTNMIRDAVGDSDSITGALEPLGIKDPRTIQPTNTAERLAAGVGEGIGATIFPEMLLTTGARVGAFPPRTVETLAPLLGDSQNLGGLVRNAIAGGAAGGGAVYAGELAPEPYKPLAATLGGLAGGFAGAAVGAVPGVTRAGARMAMDYTLPLTRGGQETLAGRELRDAASSPGAAMESMRAAPEELVPGSQPTTFQQTGDMGLGALERGAAAKDPAAFQARRAEQNKARMNAFEGVQSSGAPEAVVSSLRARLQDIDKQTQAAVDQASAGARKAASDLGPGARPEVAGQGLRSALENARGAAKAEERRLWEAVDPDGTLALPASETKAGAKRIQSEIPASAKPPAGEEAAIFEAAGRYREVVRFGELTALQSRIKAEMRAEKMTSGESPAWRRLSLLNNAVQKDLEAAIASKAAQELRAVQAGQMAAADSMAARLSGTSPKAGNAVYTPSGQRVEVEYRVVDADSLSASNLDNLQPNPRYNAALQPRDRSRAASELQVSRIAGDLQPERLGPSASAAEGAPIVGPDGMVESGNARYLAIARALKQGGAKAADYKRYLQEQGFDTEGIANPVLVRVRKTDMDEAARARFAQEANASPVMSYSASERAMSDAGRLDGELLSLYRGGDIGSAENRDFVRGFLGKVASAGEEGNFTTGQGALSLDGAQRVRSALIAAAYDDAGLVEALVDSGDESVRVFGKALTDLAGDVARLKAAIREGRVTPEADISAPMVDAAKFVQDARRRGLTLSAASSQRDAFDQVSEEALLVLRGAYGDDLSGRIARGRLEEIARDAIAEAEQQTTDARLFGEPAGVSEILSGASSRYGARNGTSGEVSFAGGNFGQGFGEGGAQARGFSDGAPGAGSPTESGPRILPEPALAPNFDQGALERLNAARAATKNRAETFDNKTLGPMRRRPSMSSPYDMPDSAVGQRLFYPGAKSFDAVKAYRNAVGDEEALITLGDYAVDRLRRAALRDDGTLDPAKLRTWRRMHSDALRAFPDLDAKFATAERASAQMLETARARKDALDEANAGALGRLLGVDDPGDISRMIGGLFSRGDAASQMMRLRGAIGKGEAGQDGLRKAVADYMGRRFVSNTEAGTSGVPLMKADQFQTFIRTNKPALSAAGFSDAQIKRLSAIADDLQQANRSISSVRLPGGSNTAQDFLAASAGDDGKTMLLKIALAALASGGGGTVVGGPLVGAGAAIGSAVLGVFRQAGIRRVDDLVTEALLNPKLALALMTKAKPKDAERIEKSFLSVVRRALLAPLFVDRDDPNGDRRSVPAPRPRPSSPREFPAMPDRRPVLQ